MSAPAMRVVDGAPVREIHCPECGRHVENTRFVGPIGVTCLPEGRAGGLHELDYRVARIKSSRPA
jgi:Ser-tRNA(Ala) deacylase AlaX